MNENGNAFTRSAPSYCSLALDFTDQVTMTTVENLQNSPLTAGIN